MKKAAIWAALALGALAALGGAGVASSQDDILKHRIDDPKKDGWSTFGKAQKTSMAQSEGVPGGRAMRVKVNGPSANPWDVAAEYSIGAPIKSGDVVLFAFWARAEAPPEGEQAAKVNVRIQQVDAPYTGVAELGDLRIGPEWKMYYAAGKSPVDLGPKKAKASVQLALARQTVEFGPAFVLDFGPNQDLNKLPKN